MPRWYALGETQSGDSEDGRGTAASLLFLLGAESPSLPISVVSPATSIAMLPRRTCPLRPSASVASREGLPGSSIGLGIPDEHAALLHANWLGSA